MNVRLGNLFITHTISIIEMLNETAGVAGSFITFIYLTFLFTNPFTH